MNMTMRMVLGLLLLKLFLSSWLLLVVGLSEVKPGCDATCGNLTVPYPFGIGPGCAANHWLDITCNYAYTPTAEIILGFGFGILLLLAITFWLYSVLNKRKERYFKQNGGLLLQQHQLSLRKSGSAIRKYTGEELRNATNNCGESQFVGRGGNSTVYKGVLPPDNKLFLSSWLFLLIASPAANAAVELSGVKNPNCNTKCGNLNVPYPFGIGVECAANEWLYITCNTSYNPPRPLLGDLEIVNISETEVLIKNIVASAFYDKDGNTTSEFSFFLSLGSYSYTFSDKRNIFFSTGCNTVAFTIGRDAKRHTSGCISWCGAKEDILDGSCSGIGCCQTPIPKNLTYFRPYVIATNSEFVPEDWTYNITSYAFLGDPEEFKFQASDLTDINFLDRVRESVPVVLDWVIERRTCEEGKTNPTNYSCQSNNSACYDSDYGYRCNCTDGYNGNPYLENGCQDIDECEDPSKHKCLSPSNCVNTPGDYFCICPKGTEVKDRKSCNPKPEVPPAKETPPAKIPLGFGIGTLLLLIEIFFLYSGLKKRKLTKLKEKFFKQNGGLLLQEHQKSLGESKVATRIYTEEELQKATNNYDESHIIGQGGNGTVYRGVFQAENKIIAIKKSKNVDKTQIEQFINEVVILAQINHKNVVKLLGCCLETPVPLLVYEFISNGTLYDHIHSIPNGGTVLSKFSWYNCLRIATESSRALAYLHSAASIPIIHRDVKSTNILLDDNYSAKVADFGASRLVPLDQTQVATILQGTPGYLDPESYQTGMLTEKSDVYSFGVVLAEILTGKTPLSLEKNEKSDVCRSLAAYFISAMKENAFLQIVDDRLVDEAEREQLYAVADLAMRCLNWKGDERPTMKDVLEELEGLMKLVEQHPWAQENTEETVNLLDDQSDLYPRAAFSISMGESSGQYSLNLNNSLMSPLNLPR